VAEAQCTCSTRQDGLTVRQTPSYSTPNVQLSYVKCSDSVAEAQRTCTTSEDGLIVRETSTYLTINVQSSMAGLNLRVVAVIWIHC